MTSARGGFAESSGASSVAPDDLVVAEAVAELDGLASPGAELIKVAAALIDEIGQAFGMAEMAQLSRDGAVRRRYFSHLQSQLVAWAVQHQIEVTDDHLPQLNAMSPALDQLELELRSVRDRTSGRFVLRSPCGVHPHVAGAAM